MLYLIAIVLGECTSVVGRVDEGLEISRLDLEDYRTDELGVDYVNLCCLVRQAPLNYWVW